MGLSDDGDVIAYMGPALVLLKGCRRCGYMLRKRRDIQRAWGCRSQGGNVEGCGVDGEETSCQG